MESIHVFARGLKKQQKNMFNTCRSHIYLPDSGWGPERWILLG